MNFSKLIFLFKYPKAMNPTERGENVLVTVLIVLGNWKPKQGTICWFSPAAEYFDFCPFVQLLAQKTNVDIIIDSSLTRT